MGRRRSNTVGAGAFFFLLNALHYRPFFYRSFNILSVRVNYLFNGLNLTRGFSTIQDYNASKLFFYVVCLENKEN